MSGRERASPRLVTGVPAAFTNGASFGARSRAFTSKLFIGAVAGVLAVGIRVAVVGAAALVEEVAADEVPVLAALDDGEDVALEGLLKGVPVATRHDAASIDPTGVLRSAATRSTSLGS